MNHTLASAMLAAIVALAAGRATADNLQVEPTRLDLIRPGAPTQLTITNRGHAGARFQATAFVWTQNDLGVMQLAPTSDVVIYPTLFTIAQGGKRSIRVATTATPGGLERSYRIFVQELPPPRDPNNPTAMVVIMRIGVPIFVAPIKAMVRGEVVGTVTAGSVRFSVQNRGSVHVKVAGVRVVGKDHAGKVVFDHAEPAWYVLAGGTRTYAVALAKQCKLVDRVAIEATTDHGTWQTTIVPPTDGCRIRK